MQRNVIAENSRVVCLRRYEFCLEMAVHISEEWIRERVELTHNNLGNFDGLICAIHELNIFT